MTVHTPYPRSGRAHSSGPSYVSATMRLSDQVSDHLVRHVRLLRDCVALSQQRWAFEIEAAVVLPAEMHLLCHFDEGEFAIGGALKLIKTSFARHIPEAVDDLWGGASEVEEIATPLVQLRCSFIENAPVRAGLVKSATDWPYSSVHRSTLRSDALGSNVA